MRLKWKKRRSKVGQIVRDPTIYDLQDEAGKVVASAKQVAAGFWRVILPNGNQFGPYADIEAAKIVGRARRLRA